MLRYYRRFWYQWHMWDALYAMSNLDYSSATKAMHRAAYHRERMT